MNDECFFLLGLDEGQVVRSRRNVLHTPTSTTVERKFSLRLPPSWPHFCSVSAANVYATIGATFLTLVKRGARMLSIAWRARTRERCGGIFPGWYIWRRSLCNCGVFFFSNTVVSTLNRKELTGLTAQSETKNSFGSFTVCCGAHFVFDFTRQQRSLATHEGRIKGKATHTPCPRC